MSSGLYLAIMLGIVGVLVAIIVPALFWKKCPGCGTRNIVDAETCKKCGEAFPEGR